ncbi:MAG: Hpt domain-containing protein [Pseudomonadota bacterium]
MQIIDDEQIGMLIEGAGLEAVLPILEAYWESNDQLTAALEASLNANDPKEIAAQAHGLKGSSANLGAVLVASRALEIELAAKEGNLDAARDAYAKLDSDIAETKKAFDALTAAA